MAAVLKDRLPMLSTRKIFTMEITFPTVILQYYNIQQLKLLKHDSREHKKHFLLKKEAIFIAFIWKFTSRDGESMESYYSRFYKLMNELTRNNLQVTTMQVNVQFLQQLQPEWSRFVTVVKQSKEIDTISYHTLFDILKQYQNEVNDIRAERIAKSANPLALLAVVFLIQINLISRIQNSKDLMQHHLLQDLVHLPDTKAKRSPNQLHLNLSQCLKKTEQEWNITTPRYNNDNQSGQFGNQRTMTVAGTRETVGSPVVQQTGIQCFNCKGFGHYAKECRKPKRVKDYTYHKERMMMCNKLNKGVPLQAEQAIG
ncbi:copia protein [Tanacetum coccineum]